MLNFLKQ